MLHNIVVLRCVHCTWNNEQFFYIYPTVKHLNVKKWSNRSWSISRSTISGIKKEVLMYSFYGKLTVSNQNKKSLNDITGWILYSKKSALDKQISYYCYSQMVKRRQDEIRWYNQQSQRLHVNTTVYLKLIHGRMVVIKSSKHFWN